jgi:hypothetical protein
MGRIAGKGRGFIALGGRERGGNAGFTIFTFDSVGSKELPAGRLEEWPSAYSSA